MHQARRLVQAHPAALALMRLGPGAHLDQHLQRIDRHHALAHPAVLHPLGVTEDADGLAVDVALDAGLLHRLLGGGLGIGLADHPPALGDDPAAGLARGDHQDAPLAVLQPPGQGRHLAGLGPGRAFGADAGQDQALPPCGLDRSARVTSLLLDGGGRSARSRNGIAPAASSCQRTDERIISVPAPWRRDRAARPDDTAS